MDGPWFVGMTSDDVLEDTGIIAQPDIVYNGETYKPNPTNYPLVTMINKDCKHPQEAYDFLEWMTTDEAQAIIADCGMIPSNTDYSTSDEYIKNHELEYKIVDFMQNNYATLVADLTSRSLVRSLRSCWMHASICSQSREQMLRVRWMMRSLRLKK